MYGWIWRHLPGPRPVRVLESVLLVVAAIVVLFLWVFPWLEPRLPFTDVTVESSNSLSTTFSTAGDRTTLV